MPDAANSCLTSADPRQRFMRNGTIGQRPIWQSAVIRGLICQVGGGMKRNVIRTLAALIGCLAAGDVSAQGQPVPPVPQPLSYAACQMDGAPEFPLSEFGTSELLLNTKSGVKRLKFAGRIVSEDRILINKSEPVDHETVALPISVDPAVGKVRCVLATIRTDVPLKPVPLWLPDEFPAPGWGVLIKRMLDTALAPTIITGEREVEIDPDKYLITQIRLRFDTSC
jgi:hypothetical protein